MGKVSLIIGGDCAAPLKGNRTDDEIMRIDRRARGFQESPKPRVPVGSLLRVRDDWQCIDNRPDVLLAIRFVFRRSTFDAMP